MDPDSLYSHQAVPESGFLIVMNYGVRVLPDREEKRGPYGIGSKDHSYRGLDRNALSPYEQSNTLAEIRMVELENSKNCVDDFLFSLSDAKEVYSLLKDSHPHPVRDNAGNVIGEWCPTPESYEIIWARIAGTEVTPPEGSHSAGFEPTYFGSDHFSPICDCMFVPRWHGTDDGTAFSEWFSRLNKFGLFNTAKEASDFAKYYLSFDWTEHENYYVGEIFLQENIQS